jgi:hypothetical protein
VFPSVLRAQLKPPRLHNLKHTGVALLAVAGVDPSEIARGGSGISMKGRNALLI